MEPHLVGEPGGQLAKAIREALPNIKRGSLAVFGDIFGGRIDNIHTVVGVHANADGSVVVEFDQGETLQVWDPSGLTIGAASFQVNRASRVRWEWFYYGKERLPQNRYFQEHRVIGDRVEVASNVDWFTPSFAPSVGRPAAELIGHDWA